VGWAIGELLERYVLMSGISDLKSRVSGNWLVMGESQLSEDLSDAEADKIVAFLNSLSGQMPQVIYPILPAETAATPRPTGEVK